MKKANTEINPLIHWNKTSKSINLVIVKSLKLYQNILIIFTISGCSTVSVVPLNIDFKGTDGPKPTDPATIGIFKNTIPFENYQEIGLITETTGNPDLNKTFEQLRKEAAKHGADAIVNYKLTSLTTTSSHPINTTTCNANGTCSTVTTTSTTTSTTFTFSGTLIRKK